MMRFIQFFSLGLDGVLAEACGTDSVYRIDARLSTSAQCMHGFRRAEQLRNVHRYPAFKIYEGRTFTQSHAVSGFFTPVWNAGEDVALQRALISK